MAIHLSKDVKTLFKGKNVGHIGTVMKDGSPHTTPVWVDVEGYNIIVNSDANYIKVGNLRRDPRVSISIVDHGDPYKSAFIRGKVAEVIPDPEGKHFDKMAKKYLNVDRSPAHRPNEERVIIVIVPEKVGSLGVG